LLSVIHMYDRDLFVSGMTVLFAWLPDLWLRDWVTFHFCVNHIKTWDKSTKLQRNQRW